MFHRGARSKKGGALGEGQGPVAPEVPQVDDAPRHPPRPHADPSSRRAPCTLCCIWPGRPGRSGRPDRSIGTHEVQQRRPLPLRRIAVRRTKLMQDNEYALLVFKARRHL